MCTYLAKLHLLIKVDERFSKRSIACKSQLERCYAGNASNKSANHQWANRLTRDGERVKSNESGGGGGDRDGNPK